LTQVNSFPAPQADDFLPCQVADAAEADRAIRARSQTLAAHHKRTSAVVPMKQSVFRHIGNITQICLDS
jgi:hypothetical protein